MAFFKTKKPYKKVGSSWSSWESSFYGGFFSTLINHPHVKLPEQIHSEVPINADIHRQLFRLDVVKLIDMTIYYFFSLSHGHIQDFKSVVKESPVDFAKTIMENDYDYFNSRIADLVYDDRSDAIITHFRDLVAKGDIQSIYVNVDIIPHMLKSIGFSDLEVKDLIAHYKDSILKGSLYYKFNIDREALNSLNSAYARDPEGNLEFSENILRFVNSSSFDELDENSVKLTKGGYVAKDACDPDLLKKTVFLKPSGNSYSGATYEELFGDNYEELSRQISSHLVNTLDITFDPTSDVIKSTRQGKIDSNKLVCATAGDLNVYQRQEENQIVRPFKVVMLGDESGSMGTSARIQAFIMEAYYNAFCEIMDEDDIFIYGHSGDYNPEVYIYNEPGVTDFKDRMIDMDSKCENYDSPVVEKIHERVRGMTDSPVLMLYFSDGAPAGCGYGGSSAVKELKRVSEKCKRDEFLVIGIGLSGRDLSDLYHFNTHIADYNIRHEWLQEGKVEPSLLKATSTYNKAVKTVFC